MRPIPVTEIGDDVSYTYSSASHSILNIPHGNVTHSPSLEYITSYNHSESLAANEFVVK